MASKASHEADVLISLIANNVHNPSLSDHKMIWAATMTYFGNPRITSNLVINPFFKCPTLLCVTIISICSQANNHLEVGSSRMLL